MSTPPTLSTALFHLQKQKQNHLPDLIQQMVYLLQLLILLDFELTDSSILLTSRQHSRRGSRGQEVCQMPTLVYGNISTDFFLFVGTYQPQY